MSVFYNLPGEAEEDHEYPYSGCGRTVNTTQWYCPLNLDAVGAVEKHLDTTAK